MSGIHDAVHGFILARQGDILRDVAITTVIVFALLVVSRVPRLSARTRHALLAIGLVKLALPIWIVRDAFARAGIRLNQPIQAGGEGAGEGTIWIGFGSAIVGEASHVGCAIAAAWMVVAMVIVAGRLIAITKVRGIARRSVDATAVQQAVLDRVRAGLDCRRVVRLTVSPEISTPCVADGKGMRLLLPFGVEYEDAELEAVFAHELTHVKRRDTTVRAVAGFVVALNWPNPFAWILKRRLHLEAESACDTEAITFTASLDRYLSAIRKSILPGGQRDHAYAGMMGSGLAERLRRMPMIANGTKSWSHAVTLLVCTVIVGSVTLGAAVPRVDEQVVAPVGVETVDGAILSVGTGEIGRFGVFVNVRAIRDGAIQINIVVKDKEAGSLVSAPRIVTLPNQPATIRSGEAFPDGTSAEMKAEVLVDTLGEGTVQLEWLESDVVTQRGTIELRSGDATLASYEVLRTPMDLMLKDAKLADVLRMFGQLSGFEIQVPVDLDGLVTADLHGVPLEDALDEVLKGTSSAWYLDGRTIVVANTR